MTGIYLQVRMNSTRLPGKALLDLPGGNVIQHAMRALRNVPVDVHALVTDRVSAPFLQDFASQENFEVFCGPLEDVLQRYILAARHYETATVIRATGDNPLVSARLAAEILDIHLKEQADLSHFLGLPVGAGVEVVQQAALEQAAQHSQDPFEHEHITTHLYRNPQLFKIIERPCPGNCYNPEARISLDTPQDYELILQIYQDLYRREPLEVDAIVQWFNTYGEQAHGHNQPTDQKSTHSSR